MSARARGSAYRVQSMRHASRVSLPTLRLDYLDRNNGKLANTLDPALVSSATDADIIAMVNDGLVVIGTDNKVHLHLADGYTVSKNHKVYTFHIRKNARFSNGHRVTAGSVRFAILRALAPSTVSEVATTYMGEIVGANVYKAGRASDVAGVKVLDNSTIRISLDKPYAYFLKTFTYQTSWPLDPSVLQGKTAAPLGNFLTQDCRGNQGAGPFTFVCFGNRFYPSGHSPSYTLVPSKFWWGRKAHLRIVINAYSSLEDAYSAYKRGQLEMVSIPTGFIVQERKNKKEFHQFSTSVVRYFVPNTNKAPMNDVHCRLAAAYAIDRNKLANTILHGTVNIIYDVVPPGFLGYYDGRDNPHFDLAKAKAELGKCRSRTVPMKLTYPTGSSDSDRTFREANRELQAVGFRSTANAISANDWLTTVSQSLENTNTQFVMGGWQQDYPDPQDYVSILLRCGSDYNVGLWCSKTFSNLVDRADMESSPQKRAQLYIQAQHLAISQGAWITLWNTETYELIKPYVRGMTGGVAYADIVPKNYDWSNVTVSNH